jgi:transposase-like protein
MGPVKLADPQVKGSNRRRVFTAAYKARILAEADACASGELGALLRREGLYSSHLTDWRRQRQVGGLTGLEPKKRGRKPSPDRKRIEQLEQQLAKTQRRLEQAEAIIDAQKKLTALLAMSMETGSSASS